MSTQNLVEVIENNKWTWVRLNRVVKLNAFSAQMIAELTAALQKIKSQPPRALLLSSNSPKAFSAGADLKERLAMDATQVSQTLEHQRTMVDALASLPIPTVVVLEGIAFGGGFELALAADMRVAHAEAKMGLTETSLGIIPGAGGTQRLSRLVGPAKAKELIFLARPMGAAEAFELGVVNAVSEEPLKVAQQWIEKMCEHAPLALQSAKRAVDGGIHLPLAQALDFERQCYERVLHSQDRVEGLQAFTQKRAPEYKGS